MEMDQSFDGVSTNNKLHVPRTLQQIIFGKACCHFQSWEFWEVKPCMFFNMVENHGKLQSESKRSANVDKLVPQENLRVFCSNIISNKRNVEACTRETCDSCNQTVEMTWIKHTLKKDSTAVEKQALIGTHKDNIEEEDREGAGGKWRSRQGLDRYLCSSWIKDTADVASWKPYVPKWRSRKLTWLHFILLHFRWPVDILLHT